MEIDQRKKSIVRQSKNLAGYLYDLSPFSLDLKNSKYSYDAAAENSVRLGLFIEDSVTDFSRDDSANQWRASKYQSGLRQVYQLSEHYSLLPLDRREISGYYDYCDFEPRKLRDFYALEGSMAFYSAVYSNREYNPLEDDTEKCFQTSKDCVINTKTKYSILNLSMDEFARLADDARSAIWGAQEDLKRDRRSPAKKKSELSQNMEEARELISTMKEENIYVAHASTHWKLAYMFGTTAHSATYLGGDKHIPIEQREFPFTQSLNALRLFQDGVAPL